MINNHYKLGKQWIIDCVYNDYQEFLPFLINDNSVEYSSNTVSFGGRQYPLWCDPDLAKVFKHTQFKDFVSDKKWNTVFEKITNWTQSLLLQQRFYHKLHPVVSWYMDYDQGGWQPLHQHDPNCITQVIYIDPITHVDQNSQAKEYGHGAMYTMLHGEDQLKYIPFVSYPGRCLIMTGDVFHGVYPVKSTPRRTVIIDYMYKQP
jgi:hypothetical protein